MILLLLPRGLSYKTKQKTKRERVRVVALSIYLAVYIVYLVFLAIIVSKKYEAITYLVVV